MPDYDNDRQRIVSRLDVHEYRLLQSESILSEIKSTTNQISASLNQLVRLEEQHLETRKSLDRAFKEIEKNSSRIAEIEREAPNWRTTQKIVWATAASALTAMASAIWAAVIK